MREGRSLRSAVESGWAKARHTILVADMVSLIAAVLLYFFAVGGVRGFAFTLGLTTIVDLLLSSSSLSQWSAFWREEILLFRPSTLGFITKEHRYEIN
jgi:preprotein translocase subunit SecF